MGFFFSKNSEGVRVVGLGTWVVIAAIIVGAIYFALNGSPAKNIGNAKPQKTKTPLFQKPESETSQQTDLPADLARDRDREKQIAREQSGNLRPDDIQKREEEIDEKYQKLAQERRTTGNLRSSDRLTAFLKPQEKPQTPTQTQDVPSPPSGYQTLEERLKYENKTLESGENSSDSGEKINFQPADATPSTKPGEAANLTANGTPNLNPNAPNPNANLLPTGTWIPCILEQDIVSSDLKATVWVTVAQDVTFRRQLQLPQQLVRLRGTAAVEPVQNMLDIQFDLAVFSDGTELPLTGFAYSAFDIRYPNRFRVRGLIGKLIVPPLFIQLKDLLYSVAGGVAQAYAQNYNQQQQQSSINYNGNPQINPVTGQVTGGTTNGSQTNPYNQNVAGTLLATGGATAVNSYTQQEIQKDLEKYKPYIQIEKGTPLWVQLDEAVNVANRKLNGYALHEQEIMENRMSLVAKGYLPASSLQTDNYPKGDARFRYDGSQTQVNNLPAPVETATTRAGTGTLAQTNAQLNAMQAALVQLAQSQGANPPSQTAGANATTPPSNSNAQTMQQIMSLLKQAQ